MSSPVRTGLYSLGIASGIALFIIGVFSVSMPFIATLAVNKFIGFLLLFGSLFHAVNVFQTRGFWNVSLQLLLAVLCGVSGYYLFAYPLKGAITLTLVLAWFFAVKGLIRIFGSFVLSSMKGWYWMTIDGVVSLVLCYLILNNFPGSATWAIGLLVGIDLMMSGLTTIRFAVSTNAAVDWMTENERRAEFTR